MFILALYIVILLILVTKNKMIFLTFMTQVYVLLGHKMNSVLISQCSKNKTNTVHELKTNYIPFQKDMTFFNMTTLKRPECIYANYYLQHFITHQLPHFYQATII